jgi:hypothetical protein
MKLLKQCLIAAGSVVALSGAAMAAPAPSYLGPTGYILTPNAEVTPGGCANIGYHFFDFAGGPNRLGASNVSAAHANIGLGDRLELGYTRLIFHDNFTPSANLANAKLSVLGAKSPVMVAGGVLDAFNDIFRTAYVVGQINVGEHFSKTWIPRSLRVGAGWGTGNVFSPINGVFVNGAVNPIRAVELHGEWMNNTGLVNTGLRIRPSKKLDGLVLDLAAVDVTGVAGGWDPAGGLSYTFCFGKGKKHEGGDYEDEGKDEKSAPAPKAPAGK